VEEVMLMSRGRRVDRSIRGWGSALGTEVVDERERHQRAAED
jgi:hypothetical protein